MTNITMGKATSSTTVPRDSSVAWGLPQRLRTDRLTCNRRALESRLANAYLRHTQALSSEGFGVDKIVVALQPD